MDEITRGIVYTINKVALYNSIGAIILSFALLFFIGLLILYPKERYLWFIVLLQISLLGYITAHALQAGSTTRTQAFLWSRICYSWVAIIPIPFNLFIFKICGEKIKSGCIMMYGICVGLLVLIWCSNKLIITDNLKLMNTKGYPSMEKGLYFNYFYAVIMLYVIFSFTHYIITFCKSKSFRRTMWPIGLGFLLWMIIAIVEGILGNILPGFAPYMWEGPAVMVLLIGVFFVVVIVRQSKELLLANISSLELLGNVIAKRDGDTASHNYRVTLMAVRLGEKLKLEQNKIKELIKGSFLHDMGKVRISDNVLLKPGKLTKEEFEVIKTHVKHGEDIIKKSEWLMESNDVILYHHEKYDGTGYLEGLKGEEIPLLARIFALVDVFDALASERPYKEPFSYEKVMEIMKKDKGTHFDPKIFDVFEGISEELYNNIILREEYEIEKMLNKVINKYFFKSFGVFTQHVKYK